MEPDTDSGPFFKFFDECEKIQKTHGRLPHWQQEQATYFLTFRLADSLPTPLLDALQEARETWRNHHPKPWSAETEEEYHNLFTSRIDRYLDQGYGSCLFRDPGIAEVVAKAFRHFNRVRYLLHSRVIMPNHVHLLLSLDETIDLGETVASWKRYTAAEINRRRGASGPLWQRDYFDRLIRDWDHFVNVARYIRINPIKGNLQHGAFRLYEVPWVERLLE